MGDEERKPGIAVRPRGLSLLERLTRFQDRELSFLLAGAGVLFLVPASQQFFPGPAARSDASAGIFPAAPVQVSGLPSRLGWTVSTQPAGEDGWRGALPAPEEAAASGQALDSRDPSGLAMGPDASVQPSALAPLPALDQSRVPKTGWLDSFSRAAAAGVSAASAWSGLPRPKDSWMKAGRQSFLAVSRDGLRALMGNGRASARLDSSAIHSAYNKLAPNQTATSAYDPNASPESYVVSGDFDRQAAGPAGNPVSGPPAGEKPVAEKKEEPRTPPQDERPEPVKDKGEKDFNSGASSPEGAGAKPSLAGKSGADMSGLGKKSLSQICSDLRGVPANPMAQKLMRAIGLVTAAEVNLKAGGQLICAEGVQPQRFAKDPKSEEDSDVNAILQRALGVLGGPEVLPKLSEAVRLCKQADSKAVSSVASVNRDVSRELTRAVEPCTVGRYCCDFYVRVQGICQPSAQSPCKDAVCADCETSNKTARQTAVRQVNSKVKDAGCTGFKRAYDDIESAFQHGQTPLRKAEESVSALNREKVGPALEAVCKGAAQAQECRFDGKEAGGSAEGAEGQDYLHRASGLLAQARQLLDELSLTSDDTVDMLKVTKDWKDWVRQVREQDQRVAGVFQEQVKLVNRISPILPKLEKAAPRWEGGSFAVDKKAVIPDKEIDEFTEKSVLKQDSGTALKPVLADRWCQSPPEVSLDCDSADEVSAVARQSEEKTRPVTQNAQKKQKDETSKRVLDDVKKALGAAQP
ncbi:MAG: hypothetical protein NTY77_18775 [Elusimicrobia bacterium]|nr:hypothetical protein [Elusimicrobiota bacterium]